MTGDESKRRASADSRDKALAVWLPRLLWPLPGMLIGAAIGFHLYFRQPGLNTDTAAPLFFSVLWSLGGMVFGALCTTCAGWLIELVLRRLLPGTPLMASGVTVVCLIGLCLALYAPIESRLPALLLPKKHQAPVRPPPAQESVCKQAPPADTKARQAWELECR
jgi:hypothetical protein